MAFVAPLPPAPPTNKLALIQRFVIINNKNLLEIMSRNWLKTYPVMPVKLNRGRFYQIKYMQEGDLNLDGIVNMIDFGILAGEW